MDNDTYTNKEDENDEPPSLLQIIDEGFSFEFLKVAEYTTNEEDYQEILSQGYGETTLIASGHYVNLDSWDVCLLLTVEYKHFLVRGLIYQDHSQVEWINENEAVNKIFLFEELSLGFQVSGAMHEYAIDMLAKELLKIIVDRYGTSTLQKDFLVIGKESESQTFLNYLNSSILENTENLKVQYISNKCNPMLMYFCDKSISINKEEIEQYQDKYVAELALEEEDKSIIREEWNSNGISLSKDFNINLEDKLSKIIYICKKDNIIQCFAIIDEILFKEAGVVEILLTYTFEQCADPDKALMILLNKIIYDYFTLKREEYNFTSICTFALPDVPLENYQVLLNMGFTLYKDYFEFKFEKSLLYSASSQSDRLENITKDRIKSKRHRRPPTKGFASKNKENRTCLPSPIAPDPTLAADIEEIEKIKSKEQEEEKEEIVTETTPNKPFRPPAMMPGMPGMGKIDLSAVVLRKTGKDVREGRRTIKLESEGNEQGPTTTGIGVASVNPSHLIARRSSLIVSHQAPTKPKRPAPNVTSINTTKNNTATATINNTNDIPTGSTKSPSTSSTTTVTVNDKETAKITKITVPLTAPVNKKDKIFTAYVIVIEDGSGNSRNVIKRYKEIHAFNQTLSKTFKKLPKFPSKKIIGNLKEEYVAKRKAKIEAYLNELVKREDITSSTLFKSFMM